MSKSTYHMELTVSELASGDDPYPDSEDDEVIEEPAYKKRRGLRVRPECMTTLDLSTATITQCLKPFKSQLSSLANLVEFEDLKPYIPTPATKKVVDADESSSDESVPGDIDDDLPPNRRRRRAVVNPRVFAYPLTKSQEKVLNQFRQADTLVFSNLPTVNCIMNLIALSTQVSDPFYGQVLFPNVKKVIFSAAMQEKSLVERYSNQENQTYSLEHPISFALDWLVYDFSLCIHSASSTFRSQWIHSHIKSDETDSTDNQRLEKYERTWRTLNPLSGTVWIDRLPRLRSISYHGVLPGDRPRSSASMEVYIYFAQHERPVMQDVDMTLKAIAKPLACHRNDLKTWNSGRLHLVDIEYLGHSTAHKFGPRADPQRAERREETVEILLRHVMSVSKSQGEELEETAVESCWAMLWNSAQAETHGGFCRTCGDECEEHSCGK